MKRRLLDLLTALSLVALVALGGLSVRSYFVLDTVRWVHARGRVRPTRRPSSKTAAPRKALPDGSGVTRTTPGSVTSTKMLGAPIGRPEPKTVSASPA